MKTTEKARKKQDVYIHGYPSMICLIWKNKAIIGYTHTYQEADAICEKKSELMWDFNINEKNGKKTAVLSNEEVQKLSFLTIHSTF